MKNKAHLIASLYLMFETGLCLEEFSNKFNRDTFVGEIKVSITLPDRSVHNAILVDLLDAKVEDFEEQEKVTENVTLSDQIKSKQ